MKKLLFLILGLAVTVGLLVSCQGKTVETTAVSTMAQATKPYESLVTTTQTELITTAKAIPKFLYPESYTADLVYVNSCSCGSGVMTDVRETYDVEMPLAALYSSVEHPTGLQHLSLPECFQNLSLSDAATEYERIALLKEAIRSYGSSQKDVDRYAVSVKTEVQTGDSVEWFDSFVPVKDCAKDTKIQYTFSFYRVIAGYASEGYVTITTQSDGTVTKVGVASPRDFDRFDSVTIDKASLDALVERLGEEDMSKSTSLCVGKTHLYLCVNLEKETFRVEGDKMVHQEAMFYTYYILLAELNPHAVK